MKCAVVTPVGPGHDLYALDAEDSVKRATAAARGPFAEIVYIKVDDGLGKMGSAAARNHGVGLAREAGAEWLFFLDAACVAANVRSCAEPCTLRCNLGLSRMTTRVARRAARGPLPDHEDDGCRKTRSS